MNYSKKEATSMRVVEFALTDKSVITTLESWRNGLRRIWNICLARLNEFEEYSGQYIKASDRTNKYHQRSASCKLPINYKTYYLDTNDCIVYSKTTDKRIFAPCSLIFDFEANYKQVKDKLVRQIVPSVNQDKKGKTTKQWLQYAELSGEKIVLTNSSLLNQFGWDATEGSYYSCPIGVDYPCPLLKKVMLGHTQIFNPAFDKPMGLSIVTKEENLLNKEYQSEAEIPSFLHDKAVIKELSRIPSKYRYAIAKQISISYQEYLKTLWGKNTVPRGKPRFKKYNELPTSIINYNPDKKGIQVDDDTLCGVAYFRKIQLKNLSTRWRNYDGTIPEICVHAFVKRANKWYLQLTGNFKSVVKDKQNKLYSTIACDLGVYRYFTCSGYFPRKLNDNGAIVTAMVNYFENPRWLRVNESELAKCQQDLANKLTQQLILWLNHPEISLADIKSLIRVGDDNAIALKQIKSEKEGIEKVGNTIWQQLKRALQKSTNYEHILGKGKKIKFLERKITKLHNMIAKNRRSFQHWLSFWIARNYDVFIAEDGLQAEKLKLKSKVKLDENNRAIRNNKRAKSGLSKSLSDGAFGQFLQLCQEKLLANGKTFIRFACDGSKYKIFNHEYPKGKEFKLKGKHPTTQECPVCGHKDKNLPYDAEEDPKHTCSNCGYTCGRDTRPGVLMCCLLIDEDVITLESCSELVQLAYYKRKAWGEKS